MASTGVRRMERTPQPMRINVAQATRNRFRKDHSMRRLIMRAPLAPLYSSRWSLRIGASLEVGAWSLEVSFNLRPAINHLGPEVGIAQRSFQLNPLSFVRRAGKRLFKHRTLIHFERAELALL